LAAEGIGRHNLPLFDQLLGHYRPDADTECRPLERRRALDLDLIIAAKPDAPLLQAETALRSPPAYE